jgi:hypothetical protein
MDDLRRIRVRDKRFDKRLENLLRDPLGFLSNGNENEVRRADVDVLVP